MFIYIVIIQLLNVFVCLLMYIFSLFYLCQIPMSVDATQDVSVLTSARTPLVLITAAAPLASSWAVMAGTVKVYLHWLIHGVCVTDYKAEIIPAWLWPAYAVLVIFIMFFWCLNCICYLQNNRVPHLYICLVVCQVWLDIDTPQGVHLLW